MGRKSLKQRFFSRYRNNQYVSNLLYYTGNDLAPAKWIFILGCYNSGTTLLGEVLSQHGEVGGLNDEGVMLTNQLPRPEDFGWRRMWLKCENEMDITGNKRRISEEIKRHWSHFYTGKKNALLEKSISNTARAAFFNDYFKPAYFIHIVRNGYAVAEGIKRKAKVMPGNPFSHAGQYPIELCAEQWVRSLQVVEEQRTRLDNFLEITYEQLTAQPDQTIEIVGDFLGISRFKTSLKETLFTVHQNHESIRNMNDSSLKRLTEAEINSINGIAKHYLEKYHYYMSHVTRS
jgi:hypothetical protein